MDRPTPKEALRAWLNRYGENAGITEAKYKGCASLLIRLGWEDKKPRYQHSLPLSVFTNRRYAVAAARRIRDEVFLTLYEEGLISPDCVRNRSRAFKTGKNKTGIPGMTLLRNRSKTGAGWLYCWKVNWAENGRARGRSFAWSRYATDGSNGSWESYKQAALWRMECDLRTFGHSMIDPGEDSLRALYRQAMDNYRGYFNTPVESE